MHNHLIRAPPEEETKAIFLAALQEPLRTVCTVIEKIKIKKIKENQIKLKIKSNHAKVRSERTHATTRSERVL